MSRSYRLGCKSLDPSICPVPTTEPSAPPSLPAAGFVLRPPLGLSVPGPRPHCPLQSEPEPGPGPAGPPPCPPQPPLCRAHLPPRRRPAAQPIRPLPCFSQTPRPQPRNPATSTGTEGPFFTPCCPSDLPARPCLPWCVGLPESLLTPGLHELMLQR